MNRYDGQTGLLVIDVQNDFADPAGSLYVRGAAEVLPLINRELERALVAGALIAYTRCWHPLASPHFRTRGGVWPVHCVRGTWGARFHPELLRVRPASVILKGQGRENGYSGFSVRDPETGRRVSTRLERVLREGGVQRVVIAGLATDYCVRATALDAVELGFQTVVLQDAVRAVDMNPGDGGRALDEIARRGGEIATAEEFHAGLVGAASPLFDPGGH